MFFYAYDGIETHQAWSSGYSQLIYWDTSRNKLALSDIFFYLTPPLSEKGGGDIIAIRFESTVCVCSSILAGGVVALERYTVVICGVSIQMSDYRICFYFFAGSMVFTMVAALMYKFPVSGCLQLYWYCLNSTCTEYMSSLYTLELFLKKKYCRLSV